MSCGSPPALSLKWMMLLSPHASTDCVDLIGKGGGGVLSHKHKSHELCLSMVCMHVACLVLLAVVIVHYREAKSSEIRGQTVNVHIADSVLLTSDSHNYGAHHCLLSQ